MSTNTPTLGGVSIAWLDDIALSLHRQGLAFRAGADAPVIEIQNITTGSWEPLTLEGRARGDCAFATTLDRDLALARIEATVRQCERDAQPDQYRTCKTDTLHLATVETLRAERRKH